MTTPEGKVKDKIRKVLAEFVLDTYWPVPSGYGASHLDFIGCYLGRYIAIEVKAPGKKPTGRQKLRIRSVQAAGGIALVIDGTDNTTTYDELRKILEAIERAETHRKL